jgi:APA family basic amino acid/polyamine antiporter
MADNRELPHALSAVHPRYRVPYRAEFAIGAVAVAVVAVAHVRSAIGFSSFAVLVYYAMSNASTLTLAPGERRWPRWLSGVGVVGCVVLAFSLPLLSVILGEVVMSAGAIAYRVLVRRSD